MTVIMIAHRLQTIKTAQNLLYLEDPTSILSAEKGTPEYSSIIERLEKTSYAHQAEDDEEENNDKKNIIKQQSTMRTGAQQSLKDDNQKKKIESQSSMDVASEAIVSDKGTGWGRIFTYYQPKIFAILMLCTAGFNSLSFPVLGFLVATTQLILIEQAEGWEEKKNEILTYFVFLCIGIGLISGIEKALFGITGENLTFNVRKDLMRGILFKQVAWFDRENRAPGILTNVLSEDVSALNGMTTETVATVVEAFVGLLLGLSIAAIISWRMALFTIAASPVMIIGVVAMSRLQWGNKRGKSKA